MKTVQDENAELLKKTFRRLLKLDGNASVSIEQKKRIIQEFPFLWAVNNKWFWYIAELWVYNLTLEDNPLKEFIPDFFMRMGSTGFSEIWVHEAGSFHEACICLNPIRRPTAKTVGQSLKERLDLIRDASQIRHVIVTGHNWSDIVIYRIKPPRKWRAILESLAE